MSLVGPLGKASSYTCEHTLRAYEGEGRVEEGQMKAYTCCQGSVKHIAPCLTECTARPTQCELCKVIAHRAFIFSFNEQLDIIGSGKP